MNNMTDRFTSRRGFISSFFGVLPGMMLVTPKILQSMKPEINHLLGQIELDALISSKPVRDSSLFCHTSGKRSILYREKKGNRDPVYSMNPIGKAIWEASDGGKSPEEISRLIHERHLVSQRRAFVDTVNFLARLKMVGAIL